MTMSIDCGSCSRRNTSHCHDCVVSFIVGREPDDAVVVDAAEYAAVRRLQRAGLVPDLFYDGPEADAGWEAETGT